VELSECDGRRRAAACVHSVGWFWAFLPVSRSTARGPASSQTDRREIRSEAQGEKHAQESESSASPTSSTPRPAPAYPPLPLSPQRLSLGWVQVGPARPAVIVVTAPAQHLVDIPCRAWLGHGRRRSRQTPRQPHCRHQSGKHSPRRRRRRHRRTSRRRRRSPAQVRAQGRAPGQPRAPGQARGWPPPGGGAAPRYRQIRHARPVVSAPPRGPPQPHGRAGVGGARAADRRHQRQPPRPRGHRGTRHAAPPRRCLDPRRRPDGRRGRATRGGRPQRGGAARRGHHPRRGGKEPRRVAAAVVATGRRAGTDKARRAHPTRVHTGDTGRRCQRPWRPVRATRRCGVLGARRTTLKAVAVGRHRRPNPPAARTLDGRHAATGAAVTACRRAAAAVRLRLQGAVSHAGCRRRARAIGSRVEHARPTRARRAVHGRLAPPVANGRRRRPVANRRRRVAAADAQRAVAAADRRRARSLSRRRHGGAGAWRHGGPWPTSPAATRCGWCRAPAPPPVRPSTPFPHRAAGRRHPVVTATTTAAGVSLPAPPPATRGARRRPPPAASAARSRWRSRQRHRLCAQPPSVVTAATAQCGLEQSQQCRSITTCLNYW